MIERPYNIRLKEIAAGPEGSLSVIQGESDIPFRIARVFYVYGVEAGRARGAHAHYVLQEVVACLSGSVTVELSVPGEYAEQIVLDDPRTALFIPPTAWRNIRFGAGAVLLALASTSYDETDYFRDFQEYEAYVRRIRNQETS